MGNGNNRNNTCICGSEKKYKKCCLGKDKMSKMNNLKIAQNMAITNKVCSAPEDLLTKCKGKIIKAHTVLKSSSLEKIASNGHVYTYKDTAVNIFKNHGQPTMNKIGIKKASTFTGFCEYHDCDLFEPLDNQTFSFKEEQIFLTAYRALCYELHAKKNAMMMIKNIRPDISFGLTIKEQRAKQSKLEFMMGSFCQGIEDLESYKKIFDEVLLKRNFSKIKYIGFEFDKVLPIMASSGFGPIVDIFEKKIRELSSTLMLENIFYSSFAKGDKGIFLICWVDDFGDASNKYATSLLKISDKEINNMVINIMITHSENIYIGPKWWDALNENNKQRLTDGYYEMFKKEYNPYSPYQSLLKLDVADWEIIQIYNKI